MADIEKTIKGLECKLNANYDTCKDCQYFREELAEDYPEFEYFCDRSQIESDALELLKKQEPKFVPDIAEAIIGCKPKVKVGHCPSCDALIHETDKFCRKCGQAVKWE